ncbi:MAG: ferritin-like domain-containing protein [Ferrovibrio sp.]|uniref:ferritin-like domain-containing protein n=1 Tax=Ferrovibrio sp. TaxID=1917215 RepID=UPI002606C3B2|nr:ferritin-like domain-containing protein [Ferrovibrio sp.]MCW0236578.1 ferritin-like domain-containing protein [Ferrovibrio sp.]
MTSSTNLVVPNDRRQFLRTAGTATLSATAVALLMGCESMARGTMAKPAEDVKILNTALGLEYQAITAYQIGAESGLLQKPALDAAVLFQTHHKEHAAALDATVRKLGGTPVGMPMKAEVAGKINAASLKTGTDVLMLAARLEKGASDTYLSVIPSFTDPQLARVAGRIAADETMHWTALQAALQQALPGKALSFGA